MPRAQPTQSAAREALQRRANVRHAVRCSAKLGWALRPTYFRDSCAARGSRAGFKLAKNPAFAKYDDARTSSVVTDPTSDLVVGDVWQMSLVPQRGGSAGAPTQSHFTPLQKRRRPSGSTQPIEGGLTASGRLMRASERPHVVPRGRRCRGSHAAVAIALRPFGGAA